MKATLIYGAGDIRVEDVPDPTLQNPTDAIVRITHSCICGSDLWPYAKRPATEQPDRIGHEFLGVIEQVGSDVSGFKAGDLVVAPFVWSDGTCDFCREGLQPRAGTAAAGPVTASTAARARRPACRSPTPC